MLSNEEFDDLKKLVKEVGKLNVSPISDILKVIKNNFVSDVGVVKPAPKSPQMANGYRTRDKHLAIQSTQNPDHKGSLSTEKEVRNGMKVRTQKESSLGDKNGPL